MKLKFYNLKNGVCRFLKNKNNELLLLFIYFYRLHCVTFIDTQLFSPVTRKTTFIVATSLGIAALLPLSTYNRTIIVLLLPSF